jgi:hypothetical protein
LTTPHDLDADICNAGSLTVAFIQMIAISRLSSFDSVAHFDTLTKQNRRGPKTLLAVRSRDV